MVSTGFSKHFLFFLLLSTAAIAADEKFYFGKNEIEFANFSETGLRISKNCLKKNDAIDCAAFTATKELRIKESELHSDMSVSSFTCVQSKSTIVIGIGAGKNQMSFCKFPDGSYIDAGSLLQYGIRNGKQ